jgi:hypothetical protein
MNQNQLFGLSDILQEQAFKLAWDRAAALEPKQRKDINAGLQIERPTNANRMIK